MHYLVFIFSLCWSALASAEFDSVIKLEKAIEERVTQFVSKVDPDAQVFVKISLKQMNLELPGTNLEMTGSAPGKEIQFESVSKVSIRIATTLEKIPKWVIDQIKRTYKYPHVTTEITTERMDTEVVSRLDALKPSTEKYLPWIQDVFNEFKSYGVWVIGFITAFALTLLFALVFVLPASMRNQASRVIAALGQLAESMGQRQPSLNRVDRSSESLRSLPSAVQSIGNQTQSLLLSPEGLLELFADCYWSAFDSYAKWLWDNLNPDQRRQTMELWPSLREYALYLQNVSPQASAEHLHPTYLRPVGFFKINNDLLAQQVKQKPFLWSQLSPIRQRSLQFDIDDKLKFLNSPQELTTAIEIPRESSPHRKFNRGVNLGSLSFADETKIFSNPNMVPDAVKPHLSTLVWAALLSDLQNFV